VSSCGDAAEFMMLVDKDNLVSGDFKVIVSLGQRRASCSLAYNVGIPSMRNMHDSILIKQ
jgi:hypothetical protein